MTRFDELNEAVTKCRLCPRLRDWCSQVATEKRRAFMDDEYWGLPVPHFGDPKGTGLIVGLAPAAHGANRTGRMFTGDRSGDWLYRSLHKQGLASQSASRNRNDGLKLNRVVITAVGHCAPPANKLTRDEVANCRRHLESVVELKKWRAFLCLGSVAWTELHRVLGHRAPKFGHSVESELADGRTIVASFHPSQQNTFTGKLSEQMLDEAIARFASEL